MRSRECESEVMSGWGRAAAGLGGVLCVLLLVGCTAPPPPPAGITVAQRDAATRNELGLEWAAIAGADRELKAPRVAVVRYTTYLDHTSTIVACLRKAGYPQATLSASRGIIDPGLPSQQSLAYSIARYVCDAQYPENPLELGYLSDAQEQYLYGYWENETVPCLRARGVAVTDLPPIGQYGEGYEDVGTLNPYTQPWASGNAAVPELVALCPPYPGELYSR
jgi:hypothetical protein